MAKNPQNVVLGIGAAFVDQVLYVKDDFLKNVPGKKGGMVIVDHKELTNIIQQSGQTPIIIPGGSCANTIRGLAHLGQQCTFNAKIGPDEIGKFFTESLIKLKITPELIPTETHTGQALCLITPDAERTMRSFLGAAQEMGPGDLLPSIFEGIRLVHLEGYTLLNPGLTERAMELAKKAGAKISLDLGSFEVVKLFKDSIIKLIKEYVDVLFGNRDEIQMLTQLPPEQACTYLSSICETSVVLLGSDGCIVGRGSKQIKCAAIPVQVVDTTGAGDLFISGFLHGYQQGHSLEDCAYFGTVTGAAAVQARGVDIPESSWKIVKTTLGIPQAPI